MEDQYFANIETQLRDYLLNIPAISSIINTSIYYYRIPSVENNNKIGPLIFFKRAGGGYAEYRYIFTVRSDDWQEMLNLRQILSECLLRSPVSLATKENIIEVTLEENWFDGGDENIGGYTSSIYVTMHLSEAEYV